MQTLQELQEEAWRAIEAATAKKDSVEVRRLTPLLEQIDHLMLGQERVERELHPPAPPAGAQATASPSIPPDSAVIEVTHGAINQSYITLTQPRRRNLVPLDGAEFEVHTDILPPFQTGTTGNMLNQRAKVSQFYQKAGVKAGDRLVWRQIGDRKFHVSKL